MSSYVRLAVAVWWSGFVLVQAVGCLASDNPYHRQYAAGILKMSDCMKCHDKNGKMPVTVCLGDNCLYSKNHSVMGVYPPPGKAMDYAPVSAIEAAGCILEDGRITCLSCHDLTKPPPHLIKKGDELCFICHTHLKSGP